MAILPKYNTPHISDLIRQGVSEYIKGAAGDGDYVAFEVPRNSLVTIKAIDIATAYSSASTGTLTVGYKARGGAIQVAGIAADSVTLSEATGIKQINHTRYFPNGGVVTMSVTKGDSSTNIAARLFFEYAVVVV